MKIAVVGSGYVGLVTGTCLAETGNYVTCVDIDVNKIEKLNAGIITIYEPGLDVIFKRNLKQERLFFTSNLAEGIKGAKIIFLALPLQLDQIIVHYRQADKTLLFLFRFGKFWNGENAYNT